MRDWVRNGIARVALVVAALALALLASELLIRSVAPQQRALSVALHGLYRPDPELGYVMNAGFRRRVRTESFRCDVRTNSLGLRDREPGPREPGSIRILGLGDSFVFGVHAGASGNCFIEQLERRLDAEFAQHPVHGPDGQAWTGADVVNAGIDGYGTPQEVGLLLRLDPVLHPDAVLLAFYLGNDFTDNSGRTRMTVIDGYQMLEASARGYRDAFRPLHRRLRLFLHAHSEVYLLLKRRLWQTLRAKRDISSSASTKPFDYYVYDSGFADCLRPAASAKLQAGIAATHDALVQLRRWCDAHGTQALVVAIPAEQQVDSEARARWLQRFGLATEHLDFDLPQQRLAALVQEAGLAFFDLTPEFAAHTARGEKLYLERDSHWNAAGHALAAQTLLPPVREHFVATHGTEGVTAH